MIMPALDFRDFTARLETSPARLRAALAAALDDELAALAQHLHVTASIDATADLVTATIRTAGVPPAVGHRVRPNRPRSQLPRRLRALRASFAPVASSGLFSSIQSDIRAALIAAAHAAVAS